MCHKVLAKLGRTDNPFVRARLAPGGDCAQDEYFVSRKLYPNVDFYSGMIYSAIGIPRSMFTVMFAIARTVGWVAHWQEMISDPAMRIGRPAVVHGCHQTRLCEHAERPELTSDGPSQPQLTRAEAAGAAPQRLRPAGLHAPHTRLRASHRARQLKPIQHLDVLSGPA